MVEKYPQWRPNDCKQCHDLRKGSNPALYLLHLYTHEDPPLYRDFNAVVDDKDERFHPLIRCMADELMRRRHGVPPMLYRGLAGVTVDASYINTQLQFNTFTSTSVERAVSVNGFTKNGVAGVLLEIETTQHTYGGSIRDISAFEDEEEILLAPLQTFDVVAITPPLSGDTLTVMRLRTVDPTAGLNKTRKLQFSPLTFLNFSGTQDLEMKIIGFMLALAVIPVVLSVFDRPIRFIAYFLSKILHFVLLLPVYLLIVAVGRCRGLDTRFAVTKHALFYLYRFKEARFMHEVSDELRWKLDTINEEYIAFSTQAVGPLFPLFLRWATGVYPLVAALIMAFRKARLTERSFGKRIYKFACDLVQSRSCGCCSLPWEYVSWIDVGYTVLFWALYVVGLVIWGGYLLASLPGILFLSYLLPWVLKTLGICDPEGCDLKTWFLVIFFLPGICLYGLFDVCISQNTNDDPASPGNDATGASS